MMNTEQHTYRLTFLFAMGVAIFIMACNLFQPSGSGGEQRSPTPTATPTSAPALQASPTPQPSACQGVNGEIEIRILAGPAEVVGLEPFAVGSVPFSIESQEPPYQVTGGGSINYQDVLQKEWGTYEVAMDMEASLEGECKEVGGNAQMHATLHLSGNQNVSVRAQGFTGDYPWQGSVTREMDFPLEEGATAQGEGWMCVLHLSGKT